MPRHAPEPEGKPAKYDAKFRNRVLALLEQPTLPGMSHWDRPTVAEKLGCSVYAVWRDMRCEGIYLQRLRRRCASTDKEFASKAADVVGLYLNPPLNAVILSADEETQYSGHRAVFRLCRDRQRHLRASAEEYL